MPARPSLRLRRREALAAGICLALGAPARIARAEVFPESPTDAQARWLAGTAGLAHSPADPEWVEYAQAQDRRWDLTLPRVRAMQRWSEQELESVVPPDRPVIYPFAGPDAMHALALFSRAPALVLIGLEPVGNLPDPVRPPAGYFARLGAALEDVHRLTFFRTHAMASAFAACGVLPALLSTVVRLGGRVDAVDASDRPARARIDWARSDGGARRLEYFQVDLANAGLGHDAAFVRVLRGLAPFVTFLKAASYLPGEPRFSSLRRILLEESTVLVQDDSGIPFRNLDAGWAVRLFGRYEAPVSPFEDRLQVDLRAAYEERAPRPLPFGIGYHVDARRSNLLIAAAVGTTSRRSRS
jgi:hypothetical protein